MMNKDKDLAYWNNIIQRYFDAETSLEEENELKEFLVSPEGQKPCYNDIRAVMSFISVGQQRNQQKNIFTEEKKEKKIFSLRPAITLRSIAAAFITFIFMGTLTTLYIRDKQMNVCYAYIGGEKITNEKIVESKMFETMKNISNTNKKTTMQEQMEEMFSPS